MDRRTNRQTNRHTDRHTDGRTDKQTRATHCHCEISSGDDLTVRKLTLERIQEVVSGSELTPSLTFYLNEGSVVEATFFNII
jgi:hypothetical protein